MQIPFDTDPWNEIIPGLYQGGHFHNCLNPPHLRKTVVMDQFDKVYSLYRAIGHGPSSGAQCELIIEDANSLTEQQLESVNNMADSVASYVHQDYSVLVRCEAGYNRSGLVVGLAMLHLGYEFDETLRLIRENRSPYALSNEYFVSLLKSKSDSISRNNYIESDK